MVNLTQLKWQCTFDTTVVSQLDTTMYTHLTHLAYHNYLTHLCALIISSSLLLIQHARMIRKAPAVCLVCRVGRVVIRVEGHDVLRTPQSGTESNSRDLDSDLDGVGHYVSTRVRIAATARCFWQWWWAMVVVRHHGR